MTRNILVVDDEPEKSLDLVHYLQSQGYTVRFARSGMECLSLLEAKRPDLVICDLEMPDVGGYGVLEAISTRLAVCHMSGHLDLAANAGDNSGNTR